MEKQTLSSHSVISFRRWTRKSYAVFNSLGRVIRIGVLCLSCSILVLPGYAQENRHSDQTRETIEGQELDEVVVSAQLSPVVQSQLMRVVQVISRTDIEQAPVRDLAGLLQNIRGVDIRKRGTFGMQADISIRGGTFDQTLVLLNGVNITDPQTGHHNLNVPVDIQSIERIEVLQGAGARIFGPNAFNGAINIITREPGNNQMDLSLSGGQHGYGHGVFAGGLTTGPVRHFLSLSGMKSDGFTENTDFASGNLFYHSQVRLRSSAINAQGGYNQKAFGANSFYTPRFPNQFEETRTGFASVKWRPNGVNITPVIYWRRHHDRFELFRNNAPEWYTNHNYHMTDVAGAAVSWSNTGRYGITSLGSDYRTELIYSNVLGNELDEPIPVRGYDDVFYTRRYQRTGLSLMAEHNVYFGDLSASAGVLTYFNSDLDNGVSFFPGLDLGWQFSPSVRWFSSISRTLRLPTFTDLFYSGPGNIGNPFLKPEESISLETGIKGRIQGIDADFTVFQRRGTNMIDWIKRPGDEQWQSMNLTRVNLTGFETGFTAPMNLSGAFRPLFSAQYSYINSGKTSGEFVSNYALDHLTHKLDLNITHSITRQSGINWRASWQQRAGGYMLYKDGVFQDIQPFEPYWMVDVKAWYQLRWMKLFVEASNLFNTEYVSVANVPQPGRWVRFGADFSLRGSSGI